jgi:bifunctional pyridoxal-dependent enzyme with beta-cystathionase and maltose regulon repressor activities
MPGLNGKEVVEKLRFYIRSFNRHQDNFIVEEPVFVVMTSFMNQNFFSDYIKTLNIQYIVQKPVAQEQLDIILRDNFVLKS